MKNVKKLFSMPFRPRSPRPTLHVPTSDDSTGRSKSVTPTNFVGTQEAGVPVEGVKKPVPATTIVESPTSLPRASNPSKKFAEVKTKNAQHDLVVLHVAYITQKSSNLKALILKMVQFSNTPGWDGVVQVCVDFTIRLITALDSPTVALVDVEQAIAMFLETINTVDVNAREKAQALRKIQTSIDEIEIAHPEISTIEQKKDSCFSKIRNKALGVALPMLQIIENGSSMIPVPMVQPLIGVVAGFLQAADQARDNYESMRWLSATAAECVIGIAERCPEHTEQTDHWTRAIETLRAKLSDIVRQAEKFCEGGVVSRFLQQGRDKDDIKTMGKNFTAAINNFHTEVGMNIRLDLVKMSRQIEDLSLETLPRLPSDRFSPDDRFQASRESEIEDTLRWIEGSDDRRFFWIRGAAGIGKSTMAHRLSDLTKKEGILAAFAYFSIGDNFGPTELVRMMARELWSLHPGCQFEIARAIKELPGTHHHLHEYLTHFLINPMASLAYSGSLVIILDALDEWERRKEFLEALRQVNLPPTLSLKFVMTSRFLKDIEASVNGSAVQYELTTVSPAICRKYFEERFTSDELCPGERRLDKLVQLADGFLIWAATVCTLVSTPHPNKPPLAILDEIISSSLDLPVGHETRMEKLYREALERIFPPDHKESRLKLFLSMVALREELPLAEFARLIYMEPRFIKDVCSRLRALQTRGTFRDGTVQPAVNLFHASFIEYLGQLNEAHGVMADNCIRLLKQVTQSDIAKNPKEAEQYISEYGVYHLHEAPLEQHSKWFLDVPSNHLHLCVGCLLSLSHRFYLGNNYSYGPVLGRRREIDHAIVSHSQLHRNDIESTPSGQNDSPSWFISLSSWFNSLGRSYVNRYEDTDNLQDIDRAISRHQSAVYFTPSGHTDLPSRFNDLGNSYSHRFELTRNLKDINSAISYGLRAVESTPSGHTGLPSCFNNLGSSYLRRFECTGKFKDINSAISYHQKAVESTPSGHADLPSRFNDLGNSYSRLFKDTRNLKDIDSAISYHQQAVESTSSGHADLPSWFNDLGNSYSRRFECTGTLEDIDSAISYHRKVVESTPSGHTYLPSCFNNLGSSYLRRFECTGDLKDIDSAISYHQTAVESTPSGHADLPSRFNDLGNSYSHRFERTRNLKDIDSAISYHQKAVESTSSGHADLPSWFNDLGNSYSRRFERTGDLEDIDSAISHHQKAVAFTASGHTDLLTRLNDLGNSHSRRFECTGNLEDIDSAISYHRKVVESTPSGHTYLPSRFNDLGNSYSRRFEHTGNLKDIDSAISYHQQAVGSTPSGHADLPSWFNDLGNSYSHRFELTRNLKDIDSAISYHQKAVEATPSGHADLPSRFNDLGNSYSRRFECTWDIKDIDSAISYHQKAVEFTPSGHADLPSRFNDLGNSYSLRFEHTGNLKDIDSAISHHQKAVERTPSGHADLPSRVNDLGNLYSRRFERTGDLKDLNSAVSQHQKAVELAPSGRADLPSQFNGLGNSYSRPLFEATWDIKDIDSAISYHQKAVKSTPGHTDLPSRFNDLGNLYSRRFERTGDIKDLDSAISHHQKAVEFTSSGHTALLIWFNDLGNSYLCRFNKSHDFPDVQSSIASYRRSAEANGTPSIRLNSVMKAAALSLVYDDSQCLVDFTLALSLLSEVTGLEQTIHCRHNLRGHSDFVRSAVTTALYFHSLDLALEWIEQGRYLVWNQLSQPRSTPIDNLRTINAPLANRFIHSASVLESTGNRSISASIIHTIHATDSAREYAQLLNEIRCLPDFEDFLRPPMAAKLLSSLPSDGPVLVFNIHETRCDALAVIAGMEEPMHISLENFSLPQAKKLQKILQANLLNFKQQNMEDNSSSMPFVLEELWCKVVQPILKKLGYSSPLNPSDRGRVWWCPAGPLAFLPLHAAGIYGSAYKPGSCVSDFVVSSYIPTVQSLNERSSTISASLKRTDVVLIGSANKRQEVHDLKQLMDQFAIKVQLVEDAEATTAKVKAEMNTHGWVHFACDSIQDMIDPLKSSIQLQDSRLELLEIIQQKMSNPELAFLSVCQTSKGDLKLSEEVVHLASGMLAAGMLAAGYRGVVGTMWSISDLPWSEFTMAFYQNLLEEMGLEGLDSTRAAYAVDYAARKLRGSLEEDEKNLWRWVPYAHFGY